MSVDEGAPGPQLAFAIVFMLQGMHVFLYKGGRLGPEDQHGIATEDSRASSRQLVQGIFNAFMHMHDLRIL